jgi:hypothetical protein
MLLTPAKPSVGLLFFEDKPDITYSNLPNSSTEGTRSPSSADENQSIQTHNNFLRKPGTPKLGFEKGQLGINEDRMIDSQLLRESSQLYHCADKLFEQKLGVCDLNKLAQYLQSSSVGEIYARLKEKIKQYYYKKDPEIQDKLETIDEEIKKIDRTFNSNKQVDEAEIESSFAKGILVYAYKSDHYLSIITEIYQLILNDYSSTTSSFNQQSQQPILPVDIKNLTCEFQEWIKAWRNPTVKIPCLEELLRVSIGDSICVQIFRKTLHLFMMFFLEHLYSNWVLCDFVFKHHQRRKRYQYWALRYREKINQKLANL